MHCFLILLAMTFDREECCMALFVTNFCCIGSAWCTSLSRKWDGCQGKHNLLRTCLCIQDSAPGKCECIWGFRSNQSKFVLRDISLKMKTKSHISAYTHNTTPIHGRIWITFEMALDSLLNLWVSLLQLPEEQYGCIMININYNVAFNFIYFMYTTITLYSVHINFTNTPQ